MYILSASYDQLDGEVESIGAMIRLLLRLWTAGLASVASVARGTLLQSMMQAHLLLDACNYCVYLSK